MSILGALNPAEQEAERRRKLEQLLEAQSKLCAFFGLDPDELSEALREALKKKQLRGVEKDAAAAAGKGIRK